MVSSRKKRLVWFGGLVTVWALVFAVHCYLSVSSHLGQCCGYEGELGFLIVFFLMWPGLLYFVVPISLLLIWFGIKMAIRKDV